MDDQDIEVLLSNDIDEDWLKSKTSRTSRSVTAGETTLLKLLESLGPALTNSKPQVRNAGLLFLTTTLDLLPSDFLQQEELGLFVNFYTDRLRDHHSIIPQTLRGLLYLCKADNLTKEHLETLLDRLFRELMVQQQMVRDRAVFYNIISHIIFNRFELATSLQTQITVGLIQGAEGEKDPRNLAVVFNCTSYILNNFHVDPLLEDIFESLAVYFPIDFTPPKGVNASVTKEELILALREGLTHPSVSQFSISLFMEKLDSDLESAKIDSLESLDALVARCAVVEGGIAPWLAEKAKLLELVWAGLKKELLGIRVQAPQNVLSKVRQLISKISYFVTADPGASLRTPAQEAAWSTWFGWVWADTRLHLSVPGTRLINESLSILTAVAASGSVQSRAVLSNCLPILVKAWHEATVEAKKQLLASLDHMLRAAAQTDLQVDGDVDGLDSVVGLYLQTANLHGLAQALPLLSKQQRSELCASVLSSVQSGQYSASNKEKCTLVELAKWDQELVEKDLLTKFLDMAEDGLPALAELIDAGLLYLTLPAVSSSMAQGDYSGRVYIGKLAQYSINQLDREKLSGSVGEILENLLAWSEKHRSTWASTEVEADRASFCTALKMVASLVEPSQVDVLHKIGLAQWIQQIKTNSSGRLEELDAILSSLSCQSLQKIEEITQQVFEVEGCWHIKASIVNKLPAFSDPLEQQALPPVGVAYICHAHVLSADERSLRWMDKLVQLLNDADTGNEAAAGFVDLLCPADWLHARTALLFRQRAWAVLFPRLAPAANSAQLSALVSLLPHVPRPLLTPVVVGQLLPLLTRALGQTATAPPALTCLHELLVTSPTLVDSYTQDIVPRCLKLTVKPNPLNTRLQALVCLDKIGCTSNPTTVSMVDSVTSALSEPVKDHKRLVRQQAMRARNRWYTIS